MKLLIIIAGSLIAVLAFILVGYVVASGPEPHISIPPEPLWDVGPLTITSTLMGAWLSMILVVIMAWFATRSMKLIPGGWQNFVEGFIDFLLTQCEEIAGKENGRRFFVVAASFFIFILVANWSALLPFYKSIGVTEDYGHAIFQDIQEKAADDEAFDEGYSWLAWEVEEAGGWGIAPVGGEEFEFDFHEGWTAGQTLDAYIIALAEHFTGYESITPEETVPMSDDVNAAFQALEDDPEAPAFLTDVEGETPVESPTLGTAFTGVDFPGDKVAMVYPFFRAAYSDLNNTLALAFVAFGMVWVWGFQAHGIGYLNKFFIPPWKNPIMTFVGLLELISEFIRILSWSFRLFGNIFAGSVLLLIMAFVVPFIAPIAIYGLELFIGIIQAIVFSLLVLVFGLSAVESHHDEEHDDEGHGDGHDHAGGAHGDATHQTEGAVQAH